jgi:hypothetical protein
MSGWTKYNEAGSASYCYVSIFYKTAVGGETSATFTAGGNNERVGHVLEITGANNSDPINRLLTAGVANTQYPAIGGLAPTVNDSLCIASYIGEANTAFSSAVTAYTNHPPWTFDSYENAAGSQFDMRSVISEQNATDTSFLAGMSYDMSVAFYGRSQRIAISPFIPKTRRIFIS